MSLRFLFWNFIAPTIAPTPKRQPPPITATVVATENLFSFVSVETSTKQSKVDGKKNNKTLAFQVKSRKIEGTFWNSSLLEEIKFCTEDDVVLSSKWTAGLEETNYHLEHFLGELHTSSLAPATLSPPPWFDENGYDYTPCTAFLALTEYVVDASSLLTSGGSGGKLFDGL